MIYSIDGVVLIDPEYIKERKVFGHVLAAFRYGREDLDVLGLTFRKDLYLAAEQIFPAQQTSRPLTRLQERLIKKLGANAFPFFFEVSRWYELLFAEYYLPTASTPLPRVSYATASSRGYWKTMWSRLWAESVRRRTCRWEAPQTEFCPPCDPEGHLRS